VLNKYLSNESSYIQALIRNNTVICD
jgi:hypothetical protein